MSGLGLVGDIGKNLLGASANRKAKNARMQALQEATSITNYGYDQAGNALDTGQKALEAGYQAGSQQRHDVAGQMTGVANQTYGAQQDLWAPWMAPGLNAYQNLDALLNDPAAFQTQVAKYSQTPEFQFKMQQATEAAKRSAAATGNRLGANQLAALQDRAQGVASQGFDQWIGRLQQMAQTGMQATGQLSNATQQRGEGLNQALNYGDTSQWDVSKGKDILGINQQRGDLALQKAADLSGLALGTGKVSADYNLAQGQQYQGAIDDISRNADQLASVFTGGASKFTPAAGTGSYNFALGG